MTVEIENLLAESRTFPPDPAFSAQANVQPSIYRWRFASEPRCTGRVERASADASAPSLSCSALRNTSLA